MIIIMRNRAPQDQIEAVVDKVKQLGFRPHISAGEETTIIGVIGDERRLDGLRCKLCLFERTAHFGRATRPVAQVPHRLVIRLRSGICRL